MAAHGAGGLHGQAIIASLGGTWATRVFGCRQEALPWEQNWFTVAAFVDALRTEGVDVDALSPAPCDSPRTTIRAALLDVSAVAVGH